MKIPSIKILKDYVEIQCCGNKNSTREQNENEDITKPEILLKIAEYKKYKLLLKSYLQLIELNSKTKKKCELKLNHYDEKKAEVYCLNCDPQLFMCNSCLTNHDKFNPKHKKIKSAGMKISDICEKKECERKGIIEYYCLDCNLHLCIGCHSNHINHKMINLKSFLEKNQNLIDRKANSNLFINKIKLFLEDIQKAINNSNRLIKNHINSNKDTYSFVNSLYNTYECSKDIPNFHSINNILINNIDTILKDSNIQLMNKIQFYFANALKELNQLKNQFNQLQSYDQEINPIIPPLIKDPQHLSINRTISNNTWPDTPNLLALYTLDNENYELAHVTNNQKNKIEIIELKNDTVKLTINSAHSANITAVKHYFDKYNKKHYLISSATDKSVKLWDINNNYKNILNISNAANKAEGYYYPLFMLFIDNNPLIGAANQCEKIKIYDKYGSKVDTINCEYEYNYHSEAYYIDNGVYILISGRPGIRLFDYISEKTKFKLISNNNNDVKHCYSIIEKIKNEYIIFDSDNNGNITLWNFNSGEI